MEGMHQGGFTALKVSWHRSDGSGEARAPRPLTRQRGGENFFFRRGDCILFLIQRPFLVGASGYFLGY